MQTYSPVRLRKGSLLFLVLCHCFPTEEEEGEVEGEDDNAKEVCSK